MVTGPAISRPWFFISIALLQMLKFRLLTSVLAPCSTVQIGTEPMRSILIKQIIASLFADIQKLAIT